MNTSYENNNTNKELNEFSDKYLTSNSLTKEDETEMDNKIIDNSVINNCHHNEMDDNLYLESQNKNNGSPLPIYSPFSTYIPDYIADDNTLSYYCKLKYDYL